MSETPSRTTAEKRHGENFFRCGKCGTQLPLTEIRPTGAANAGVFGAELVCPNRECCAVNELQEMHRPDDVETDSTMKRT